jgi:hypothetical protein
VSFGRRGVTDFDLDAHPGGAWLVPLELVLAVKTGSVYPSVVRKRMQLQDWPLPDAMVFKRG